MGEKNWKLKSPIDEFQINEINVDLRTSGFDKLEIKKPYRETCNFGCKNESVY